MIDYGTGVILAAFATGGFGLLAAVIAYATAIRRPARPEEPGSEPTAEQLVDNAVHALEENSNQISAHHDQLTREMQTRFESMVRGFNGKLMEMTLAVNKMATILDERLPRRWDK